MKKIRSKWKPRVRLNYIKLEARWLHGERRRGWQCPHGHHQATRAVSPRTSSNGRRGPAPSRSRTRFRILLTDKNVKAVLINIFAASCVANTLAIGWWRRPAKLHIEVPIVVRMEGTNVEMGRQILMESGLNFTVGLDMRDAAQKVVRLAA